MPRTSTIPTLLGCTTLPVCVSTTRTASTPIAECTTSGRTAHTPGAWHQTDLTVRRLALHHAHTLSLALAHAALTCALALPCALACALARGALEPAISRRALTRLATHAYHHPLSLVGQLTK